MVIGFGFREIGIDFWVVYWGISSIDAKTLRIEAFFFFEIPSYPLNL
jgi:hypothetical protein